MAISMSSLSTHPFLAGLTNSGYQVFETHISGLARGLSARRQRRIKFDLTLSWLLFLHKLRGQQDLYKVHKRTFVHPCY